MTKTVLRSTFGGMAFLALVGARLFVSAGRWDLSWFWAYLGVWAAAIVAGSLALQHDLELIALPDLSPALTVDRLRKKQQLVTCTLAFSLFQRAYLMFHGQSDRFRARQWAGWNARLERFLNRDTTRDAWHLSRAQFDAGFQRFVDAKIVGQLRAAGVDPAIVHAFEQTGLLVWEYNQDVFIPEQLAAWEQALKQYRTSRAA